MAHAWKACWVQALGGSNPPFSAVVFGLIFIPLENSQNPDKYGLLEEVVKITFRQQSLFTYYFPYYFDLKSGYGETHIRRALYGSQGTA